MNMKRILNTALPLGISFSLGLLSPLAYADGLLAVNNPAKNGTQTLAYAAADACCV